MADLEQLVMGIDGGGTSTRVWLVDRTGRVRGRGIGGPSNLNFCGKTVAGASLRQAAESALTEADAAPEAIAAAFLGIAGAGRPETRRELEASFFGLGLVAHSSPVSVDHDIRIALAGGLRGEPGIALIAGTGSSCYGRDAEGNAETCGGWGFPVDDVGSGAWLGLRALQVAARQTDGRAPETPLLPALLERLEADSLKEYLNTAYAAGLDRTELARLAPLVVEQAFAGDAQAMALVEQGADGLAELVQTTAAKLSLAAPSVVLAGGLATSGGPFQHHLEDRIRGSVSGCRVVKALHPPVAGAVIEAARSAGWALDDTFFGKLEG